MKGFCHRDNFAAEAMPLALAIIKKWEGLELEAYPDPASGGDPWTIGYGATGPGIREGVTWTQQQAEDDLRERVFALMVKVCGVLTRPVNDAQLAAMTSLAYNIGAGAFSASTLVRRFNQGDVAGASAEFLRWVRAAGEVMRGLQKRRADERALFDTETK